MRVPLRYVWYPHGMTSRRRPTLTVESIADGLLPLVVPLEWVSALPGNPRRGKVEAIRKSLERFGQRKPITVRITGEVDGHPIGYATTGNHTIQAMKALEWNYAAVIWLDDDEETAKAWSLADNRSHDLGAYDSDDLAKMVSELSGTPALLDAAGFDAAALERLARQTTMGSLGDAGDGANGGLSEPRGLGTPVISTSIVFDDEAQQQAWYRLVRHLRETYTECDTLSERLTLWIADTLGDA